MFSKQNKSNATRRIIRLTKKVSYITLTQKNIRINWIILKFM